eukprot:4809902-Alexandrium_andersonii.AAC.1
MLRLSRPPCRATPWTAARVWAPARTRAQVVGQVGSRTGAWPHAQGRACWRVGMFGQRLKHNDKSITALQA